MPLFTIQHHYHRVCVCVSAAVYVCVIMLMCTLSLVLNIVVLNINYLSPQTHMSRWVRQYSVRPSVFYFDNYCGCCLLNVRN